MKNNSYKPSLLLAIIISLVCIAPYFWLIVDILDKRYTRLLFETIISLPLIILITLNWIWYIYEKLNYKKSKNKLNEDTTK